MWIFLVFLLAACENVRQDFCVEQIRGVNEKKVLSFLHNYQNANSSKKIVVDYEIDEAVCLIDENGNSNFQDLTIHINVKCGSKEARSILQYPYYGYDSWKYDDTLFDMIARKISDLEKLV